jgi:hypothetical protein
MVTTVSVPRERMHSTFQKEVLAIEQLNVLVVVRAISGCICPWQSESNSKIRISDCTDGRTGTIYARMLAKTARESDVRPQPPLAVHTPRCHALKQTSAQRSKVRRSTL